MIFLALIFAVFFMFIGVNTESVPVFLFGLLYIIAIPGFWKSLKRVFRFSLTATFIILVGIGISALSFPLLGVIASGFLVLHSDQMAWGFDPAPLLPESAKE